VKKSLKKTSTLPDAQKRPSMPRRGDRSIKRMCMHVQEKKMEVGEKEEKLLQMPETQEVGHCGQGFVELSVRKKLSDTYHFWLILQNDPRACTHPTDIE
jgi:hypothetical protein